MEKLSLFQVLQRYASFIRPALQPASWNAEDSKKLVDTIARLRIGNYIPWFLVTQSLAGYTAQQLRSRWKALNPEIVRGQFTQEEDFVLVKVSYLIQKKSIRIIISGLISNGHNITE